MKALKKFNRGVIVTVIAVLCVSIYLIQLDIARNSEKPAIEKVVESYLKTYVNYNMLPENYRTSTPDVPQTVMDSYTAKMESDIKGYFAADDSSYKFITDMLKSNLQSQKTESTVIYSYDKTISKYTEFNYDNSTVTVTFETNSVYDGPDKNDQSLGRVKLNAVTTDTVVLKKVDGEWKVVYSNINRPSQRNSLGGGITIRKRF